MRYALQILRGTWQTEQLSDDHARLKHRADSLALAGYTAVVRDLNTGLTIYTAPEPAL